MALQAIWNDLSDEIIRKSVLSFRKRLALKLTADISNIRLIIIIIIIFFLNFKPS